MVPLLWVWCVVQLEETVMSLSWLRSLKTSTSTRRRRTLRLCIAALCAGLGVACASVCAFSVSDWLHDAQRARLVRWRHTTRCHFQSISNYSRRTGRFGLRTLGRQSEHGADNQCTQLFKWLVGLCPVPIVPGSAGKRCSRQYLYPFYTDLPTYDMLQRVVVDLRWLDPGLGRKAIQR